MANFIMSLQFVIPSSVKQKLVDQAKRFEVYKSEKTVAPPIRGPKKSLTFAEKIQITLSKPQPEATPNKIKEELK